MTHSPSGVTIASTGSVVDGLKRFPATFARLSSNVECIKKDVLEIKVDLCRMNARLRSVDERLRAKIDVGALRAECKIDDFYTRSCDKLDALRKDLHSTIVWAFTLYVAQGLGLMFALAKGIEWI